MKVFYKNAQINNPAETDYENVLNRAKINHVLLEGDKNTEEINATWFGTLEEFELLPEKSPTTIYIIDDGVPAGVTKNYFYKIRKPHINGVELEGAKISSDLSMYTKDEVDNLIASMRSLKVVSERPVAPLPNTMYYVGPRIHPVSGEEIYDVYLYDSLLTEIYLGTTYTQVLKTGDGSSVKNNVVSTEPDTVSVNTNASNQLQIKWLADKTAGADDSKPVYLQNSVLKSFTHTIMDLIYPVGSIYKTTTLTTAAQVQAKFGGTWQAWGAGRCPVGVSTDTEFNTVEKTGGEKTVKLTTNQIPSHYHTTNVYALDYASTTRMDSNFSVWNNDRALSDGNSTSSVGGNAYHNNLMPYTTCYMYKRTA